MPVVSIVIPTHNRAASLNHLLRRLEEQTYSKELMEVIVVADGCRDKTSELLQNHKAAYTLLYLELTGEGAATARNKGAAIANGQILLFIDDDIDPSDGLVAAHVAHHQNENTVVIGYLAFLPSRLSGFIRLNLRSWWEDKFYLMRHEGYRFSYEDLLSGNFSLSAALFKNVQGFNTEFKCREDYEIGLRLIQSGACFVFSIAAWGYHCDESTNLYHSLQRKKQEGKADIQFWRIHQLINIHNNPYLSGGHSFVKSVFLFAIRRFSWLTDLTASFLVYEMYLLEWLRLRNRWQKLNYRLHRYWYLRGMIQELDSHKQFDLYMYDDQTGENCETTLEIDLRDGIDQAKRRVEEVKPHCIKLKYDNLSIGQLNNKTGAEKLRGVHLIPMLAKEVPFTLAGTVAMQQLIDRANKNSLVSK